MVFSRQSGVFSHSPSLESQSTVVGSIFARERAREEVTDDWRLELTTATNDQD